jgi:1,3-propanediol dehydrogenase
MPVVTSGPAAFPRQTVTQQDPPELAPGPPDKAARPGVIKLHAPEIVFGLGSLAEAGFAARRLGAEHPLRGHRPGVIEAGWAAALDDRLADAGLDATVWSDLTPNPKDHEIAAGFARYADSGCDVIIAIGGGSVMDAAKGIAILTGNSGEILDYSGIDRVRKPIPPLLMIPSTAGTGADVSQFCIITDTASAIKVTIMGRALVPDISVTDPALLAPCRLTWPRPPASTRSRTASRRSPRWPATGWRTATR